jgi:ssDNA-binding Zn-finger/Zn-ribbon topoisomerase 1
LAHAGCCVDTREDIHEKIILLDRRIVWIGSLNALSYAQRTDEAMLRLVNEELAEEVAEMLAKSVVAGRQYAKAVVKAENPECPQCSRGDSRRTYYGFDTDKKGGGAFFECESQCGWIVDSAGQEREKRKKNRRRPEVKVPPTYPDYGGTCQRCKVGTMVLRRGSKSWFYGCTMYSELGCRGMLTVRDVLKALKGTQKGSS